MTPTLLINASHARKNLYSLIDKVIEEKASIVIYKEGTKKKVLMTHVTHDILPVESQLVLVHNTKGAIKTNGYIKNEFNKARKYMVKDLKKHYVHD